MNAFNWGFINSGFEFQALCGALLGFEYPTIEQFSAPGPDLGVDGFLDADATVYQFKYHREPTAAKTKSDALTELERIIARKAKGTGNRYWSKAKRWTLVANVEANPQLREVWEKEVIPQFAAQGLVAELVTKENLEGLLIKHPSVAQAYFQKENRAFLTLNEAVEFAKSRRIHVGDLENLAVGWKTERDAFLAFLSDQTKKLLVLTGPGGIGKTRFLLEAGRIAAAEKQFSVYWANIATLESSTNWTLGIPFGRETILLLDEPTNPQTARILLEQIQTPGSPLSKWKIVVAIRSQNAQMVEALTTKRIENLRSILELKKLSNGEISSIALELISITKLKNLLGDRAAEISNAIAKIAEGFPIWTVVAVQLMEEKGSWADLPKDQWELAKEYVRQAISSVPEGEHAPRVLTSILNWVALFGDIRIEDQKTLEFLVIESGAKDIAEVSQVLDALRERKIIQEAGRIRRIKPDVVRDHILHSILLSEHDSKLEPTAFAVQLLKRITDETEQETIPRLEAIIGSLNHIELIQRLTGRPVNLLTPLVAEVSRLAATGSAIQQYAALQLAKNFASSRPFDLVSLCRSIRLASPIPSDVSDSFWGKRVVEHRDSLLELPWAIVGAARYALGADERLTILEELVDLCEYESRGTGGQLPIQPNDGKRAYQVLEKIIFAGPGFFVPFEGEAEILANRILDELEQGGAISPSRARGIQMLFEPLISIEREHVSFEDGKMLIKRFLINPDHPVAGVRTRLLNRIWGLLKQTVHGSSRQMALEILHKNHRALDYSARHYKMYTDDNTLTIEALGDLKRIRDFVGEKWPSTAELRLARRLWDWHFEYDERTEFKNWAGDCEREYLSRPKSSVFSRIFNGDYLTEEADAVSAAKELTASLLKGEDGSEITSTVLAAIEFAGGDRFWARAMRLASELAMQYPASPAVTDFVHKNIASSVINLRQFSAAILCHYLQVLRAESRIEEQQDLLERGRQIVGVEKNFEYLLDLYFRPSPGLLGHLNNTDLEFFESFWKLPLDNAPQIEMVQISIRFIHLGWDRMVTNIERCFGGLSLEQLPRAVSSAIDCIQLHLNLQRDQVQITRERVKWLFQLLLRLPRMDETGSKVEWDLQQLTKKTGFKFSVSEFVELLKARIAVFESGNYERYDILPSVSFDFSQFVDTLPNDSAAFPDFDSLMEGLFSLHAHPYPVNYYLPEWIVRLDPSGFRIPDIVVQKLENLGDKRDYETIRLWARYGSQYFEGTPAWRKIALRVADLSSVVPDPKERRLTLSCLANQRIEGWSGRYGEFHPRWQEAVDRAEKLLVNESDRHLREFFQMKLDAAKESLNREKMRHAEEHGND